MDGWRTLSSRAVRRSLDQCCNEGCNKTRQETKMLTCTGCKIALYCSQGCQRIDWPAHKRSCKAIQDQNAIVAQFNAKVQQLPADASAPDLLPGEITTEVTEFFKHFQLPLLISALNAFRVSPTSPIIKGWEDACFIVAIRRRINCPTEVPSWARYQVSMARRVLWDAMEAVSGEHSQFPFFKAMRAEALQRVKVEHPDGGLLVIWFCYVSDQFPRHVAAPFVKVFTSTFAREEAYFLPPDTNPGEWLQQTVDKAAASVLK